MDRLKRLFARVNGWIDGHRLPRITKRAIGGFLAHEALQYAGSMAYFAVLSLFQLLVLAVVVGSLVVGDGQARDIVVDNVSAGSPIDAETVGGIIDSVIESRGAMTVISFGFLLWSALGIFSALSSGIGRVFENAPPRPFLADKLLGLFLMGLTGILAVASVAIGIVTGILQRATSRLLTDIPGGETAVWLVGLVAPVLLIFLAFLVIYRVVPNRPVTWAEVLPGAMVAAALWTILRFGFTWYATSVADYESAFGPLSTGITLLVFLYFASVIVLLGAEFARARAVEDDVIRIGVADPRFLPVPTTPALTEAPARAGRGGGVPRPILLAGGALLGVLIGRWTKRDEYDD